MPAGSGKRMREILEELDTGKDAKVCSRDIDVPNQIVKPKSKRKRKHGKSSTNEFIDDMAEEGSCSEEEHEVIVASTKGKRDNITPNNGLIVEK